MTREEREVAIKVIRNFPVESTGERKAVLTAIEVLEQVIREDVISRDAVYGILMRTYFRDKYSYEEFKDRLEQIPPANTQPKTGYWIPLGNYDDYGNESSYKCSECGTLDTYPDNFCPECGAKMLEIPTGLESEE